uniref:Prevent-host-death family protein n=1 Tax=mine drainage metagenome TaxID=410659 RepID=E6PYL8_9ZZZZ
MEEAVSAAEANRRFSHLLRKAREGGSFIVTSHGRPVARITPPDSPADGPGASEPGARKLLLDRLSHQEVVNTGPWTREELYDRP